MKHRHIRGEHPVRDELNRRGSANDSPTTGPVTVQVDEGEELRAASVLGGRQPVWRGRR
jgi:hypothetical protein